MASVNKHALLIAVSVSPRIYEHPCRRIRKGYEQLSSDEDVELMSELLVDRFDFPRRNVRVLKTEEATRDAILAAMAELVERAENDSVVVFYYSGHGSRIPDLGSETIVPYDADRRVDPSWTCEEDPQRLCAEAGSLGEVPWNLENCGPRTGRWAPVTENGRDIRDTEIADWVQRLNEKTSWVTLIFDCCHSGSMARPVGTVREAVPDLRSAEELSELDPETASFATSAEPHAGRIGSGWLPEIRDAVVVAACRASEYAWERARTGHGLFTYHLHRALDALGPEATWMDVVERTAPEVTSEQPAQHPQLEGEMDRQVFGHEKIRASSYLPVLRVEDEGVDLWGGAVAGVRAGSVWTIRSGAASSRFEEEERARIRIEHVRPATARGQVIEGTPADRIEPWQRAFLVEQRVPAAGLRVAIAAPAARRDALAERLAESRLLELFGDSSPQAEDGEPAAAPDVTVCFPEAVEQGAGAPTWRILDADRRLQARSRPDDDGVLDGLLEDLVKLARFQGLRKLTNPDPESPLRERVELRILRSTESGLEVAAPDPDHGMVVVEEGDLVDFEIENRHHDKIWLSLLELDLDHSIALLMPVRGHPEFTPGGRRLDPGQSLRLGRDYYWRQDGLPVSLPEGFPWSTDGAEGPAVGVSYFKLLVTSVPADFEFLQQGDTRFEPIHPLQQLARLYCSQSGTRSLVLPSEDAMKEQDWTVVSQRLGIRRRTTDE